MSLKKASLLILITLVLSPTLPIPTLAVPPTPPNLVQGGVRDDNHDWTLGATGARGWIWAHDFETTEARQILITQVAKGSPADGTLLSGDVILGVGSSSFDSDARKEFGKAITEAESLRKQGILQLLRWRAGQTKQVTLHLKPMGDYGSTGTKAERIVAEASRYLLRHGLGEGVGGAVNALGLLSTGLPLSEYLPPIKALAHKMGAPNLKLKLAPGMFAWEWSYANLFLTEYYLATKDAYVLPAIKEYSTKIAQGQSVVGTWGHGMSLPENEGGLGGYGAINQSGLSCWLSMILAQKCGVSSPTIQKAIARSHRFFGFYTGKGSIPYGDHAPYWFLHDNNGKNGLAAVAFDLIGDDAGTRFFSRMSVASYGEREYGHTGNYFSYLWGALGVARSGNTALEAHLKEQYWYYDMARSWEGGFLYPGVPGERDSYEGWDMTGVFLLTYSAHRHKIAITGRGMSQRNLLTGKELAEVIEDGRSFDYRHIHDCYRGKSDTQMLHALSSWSPAVRHRAATALVAHKSNVVPQLIGMLEQGNLNGQYGACHALELIGKEGAPAVDALIATLSSKDPWLQIRAAYALAGIGKPARRSVPFLLNLALASDPKDSRQTTRRYLCMALFLGGYVDTGPRRGLLADSVDGVDTDRLIPLLRKMLATDDGLVRAQIGYLYDKLKEEELNLLWPDIVKAVETRAPSGEMYANEVRLAGLNLMAKYHIKEGVSAIVRYARTQDDWASENRTPVIMSALKTYGAAARVILPELRNLATFWKGKHDFPDDCNKKRIDAVEEAIQAIEKATQSPSLRSITPLKR